MEAGVPSQGIGDIGQHLDLSTVRFVGRSSTESPGTVRLPVDPVCIGWEALFGDAFGREALVEHTGLHQYPASSVN